MYGYWGLASVNTMLASSLIHFRQPVVAQHGEDMNCQNWIIVRKTLVFQYCLATVSLLVAFYIVSLVATNVVTETEVQPFLEVKHCWKIYRGSTVAIICGLAF